MSDDINSDATSIVLSGMVSGESFELIEKRLKEKGLSQDQVNDLIERGIATKEAMYENLLSMKKRQMRHPRGSSPPGGKYFESPVTTEDRMLCSDNMCPCSGKTTLDPGKNGYLFISQEVVDMRRDSLSWEKALRKAQTIQNQLDANIVFDSGTVNPILICEQATSLRKLDLEVAAADAENWVKTGICPLRKSPLIKSKQWWQFWK